VRGREDRDGVVEAVNVEEWKGKVRLRKRKKT
jgi:hypothetical protein